MRQKLIGNSDPVSKAESDMTEKIAKLTTSYTKTQKLANGIIFSDEMGLALPGAARSSCRGPTQKAYNL